MGAGFAAAFFAALRFFLPRFTSPEASDLMRVPSVVKRPAFFATGVGVLADFFLRLRLVAAIRLMMADLASLREHYAERVSAGSHAASHSRRQPNAACAAPTIESICSNAKQSRMSPNSSQRSLATPSYAER